MDFKLYLECIDKSIQDYLNKHQTKPTMKNNLLPFDLEEAKKDPSRVRYEHGEKPVEIVFLNKSLYHEVITVQSNGIVFQHSTKSDKIGLRLTPKRMFINKYSNGPILWSGVSDDLKLLLTAKKTVPDYEGTFELIPVKEDEAN